MFDSVEWLRIPRKKKIAASIVLGVVHRVTWLDQPPPSLMYVLTSDGLPCPPRGGIRPCLSIARSASQQC
ncbi:unnamed protein product [Prunus armeniaca]|uniref:Uncharacterized protein n=1 Tax=Prunus armeniaca TaxID=36596 RepID=A0A6J5W1V4_PRUAR|nr:unnamed protein product [Prunus armeniaca]